MSLTIGITVLELGVCTVVGTIKNLPDSASGSKAFLLTPSSLGEPQTASPLQGLTRAKGSCQAPSSHSFLEKSLHFT